ncbi:MAG: PadR family transcriptional regulator [Gemmatimonadota bacterium]|jgi:PadR family transcriptional regulator, regulatory protein PadR
MGESLELIKGTLDVLILKALSWGPMHGYAVSRWIRETTGHELSVEEGALYPALRRLESKSCLAAEWGVTDTGREARFYELTDEGRAQLREEVATWRRYVAAMARVLEAPRPAPGW